jgi:hypothetical protein
MVVRARLRPGHEEEGVRCQTWWGLKKDGRWVFSENVSLEGLGGFAGLYMPPVQPSRAFFTLVRFGNYDGQLIKILPSGKVLRCPGGNYFLTPDNQYMVSLADMDGAFRMSATNLKDGSTCFTLDFEGEITAFLQKGNQVLVQVEPNDESNWPPRFYAIDFQRGISKRQPDSIKSGTALMPWAFEPAPGSDCACEGKAR